jgi:hypothetical protein
LAKKRSADSASGSQSRLAHAYFFSGRHEEAWMRAKSAVQRWPRGGSFRIAAAIGGMIGQTDETARNVALLLKVDAGRRVSNLADVLGPYRHPEDLELYKQGLRLAGLPE